MTRLRHASTAWGEMAPWQRIGLRLVLLVFIVMAAYLFAAPPTMAGDVSTASVRPVVGGSVDGEVVEGWSDDPSNYLIVHRWQPVTFSPSGFLGLGSVTSWGPHTLSGLLLSFVVFAVRLFMMVVSLTSGGDLVTASATTIDTVFAKIGNALMGTADDGTTVTVQGFITIGVLAVLLMMLSVWRTFRGGFRAAGRTFIGGMGAVAALVIMTSGAQANVANGNSDSPTVASPAWVITSGNRVAAWVGDLVQQSFSAMTNTLDQRPGESQDECERYINAIHHRYAELSNDTNASGVLIAMDSLMVATLWDNVRVSSMGGDTESTRASWCRFSEMEANVPLVDQVQMSRIAGLYSDIVGYSSAVALEPGGSPAASPTAVTNSGEWINKTLAAEIFGPSFARGDHSSRAMYFWAACQWDHPGASVSLNPAWSQVQASSAANDAWFESLQNSPLSLTPVGVGLTRVAELFGATGHPGVLTDDMCRNVVQHGLSDDAHNDGARAFQYGESYSLIGTLRAWNVSGIDQFNDALRDGDVEAYNFYRATQGLDSSDTALGVVAATVSSGLFLYFALPITIGLLAAQIVGIIAWMLLPLALAALVVPVYQTKRLATMAGRTVVFSLFASVLFQLIMQFALFVYSLVGVLLVPSDGLGRWAVSLIGAVLGFYIVRRLAKMVFLNDPTSIRGALRMATQVAARPVVSERGDLDPDMGFRRPGWLSRASSHAAGAAVSEGRRTALGLLSRKGAGAGGPADALGKTGETAAGAGAAAVGAGAAAKSAAPAAQPTWRTAANAAAAGAAGSAGIKPTGPQVRGQYVLDPKAGTFSIAKDSVISAAAAFPAEADLMRNAVSPAQYRSMSPRDRAAYIFDPVSGQFVPKLAAAGGISGGGLSASVSAPLSALTSQAAPPGVSQEDWDKTAQMRAAIAQNGFLGATTPQRMSVLAGSAEGARAVAQAAGVTLPDAPDSATLAQQGPGVLSAENAPRAVALSHWPNGQVREGRFENRHDGLRSVSYNEDGTIAAKVYERDGVNVARRFDPSGAMVSEAWMYEGAAHRVDGPASIAFDPATGAVLGEQYALGGKAMPPEVHARVVAAAREAVAAQVAAVSRSGVSDIDIQAIVNGALSSSQVRQVQSALGDAVPAVGVEAAVTTIAQTAVAHAMAARMVGPTALTDPAARTEQAMQALATLDRAHLDEIARVAAAEVQREVDRYAGLTNADPAKVQSAARRILSGAQVSEEAARRMVRLVLDNSEGMAAAGIHDTLVERALMAANEQVVMAQTLAQAQHAAVIQAAAQAAAANPERYAKPLGLSAADLSSGVVPYERQGALLDAVLRRQHR